MTNTDTETLIAQADRLLEEGNTLSALSLFRRILDLDPSHAYAATRLADILLAQGHEDEASSLLQSALAYAPRFSPIHLLLARIATQRGDTDAALLAYDKAIQHDNAAWGARIEKAQLLESVGRDREAALCWGNAMRSMPETLRESPQMHSLVAHARTRVTNNQATLREALFDRVGSAMQEGSPSELERFSHMLDIVTGRREFVTAKPLFLPIPRLPAIPYFDRASFPWATSIEAMTQDIRRELGTIMTADEAAFTPYVQTRAGDSSGQFAQLDQNKAWSAYFLWKHGQKVQAHCERCPITASVADIAPVPRIHSRAPAVFFSRLDPGVHIPPHHGATNARLTVHLPLIVPEQCLFRVGDETRAWKEGELLIFDDTILHEAWNGSSHQRVVLIFDIWHPMLTALERELVTQTVETLVGYYDNASELGEL